MTDTILHSQPEPPRFAAARLALDAALAGPMDVDTRLAIGRVLLILGDVFPPYPPLADPTEPLPADIAIESAIADLRSVVEARGPIGETMRAGRAVKELRTVQAAT